MYSARVAMLAVAFAAPCLRAGAQRIDLSRATLVDLTREISLDAAVWPGTKEPFKLDTLVASPTAALFRLTLNEHFATHMDAPRHASGTGWSNEAIPLSRLIAPAIVIDISRQAQQNRDYALTPNDVHTFEREHGRIPRGAIVLLRTGWSQYWGDPPKYFGNTPNETPAKLHFPSFGVDAAKLLVERGVGMLGIDAPSTDIGAAPTFAVHQILGAANVPALENLADLSTLPPKGAVVFALPIKTRGGSGGPVRVVAAIPR